LVNAQPAWLPTAPVESGFDSVALDHDHDLFLGIAQPVAFQKEADLLLGPFYFAADRNLPALSAAAGMWMKTAGLKIH
jgi:hypothetical protein